MPVGAGTGDIQQAAWGGAEEHWGELRGGAGQGAHPGTAVLVLPVQHPQLRRHQGKEFAPPSFYQYSNGIPFSWLPCFNLEHASRPQMGIL